MEHPDVDGVFASSDVIGAHVLQACSNLGIEVPEQLKIVGFDDVNIAQFTSPGSYDDSPAGGTDGRNGCLCHCTD